MQCPEKRWTLLSLRYPGAELAGAAAGGEWDEAAGEILAALVLAGVAALVRWLSLTK